jgi:hypothetical protein
MAYGSTQQNYAGPVNSGDMIVKNNQASPGIAALLRKQNMKGAQGIFQLPDTQQANPDFYNQSLMNVQNEIQGQTQTLNAMAPEGESLAYINEQEAGILKLLGGSGDMTPQGIPSFARGRKGATGKFSKSKAAGSQRAAQEARQRKLDAREAPKAKEQNILQKILGGGNQEVKDIVSNVKSKINEVENDPNLSNYKKQQLIKQLNFAKSGGFAKTGFSMGDVSNRIMQNVDASRRGSVDLGIQDLINLGYGETDVEEAQKLIEKYGRAVVIDPNTGQIKISQPTIREVGGDIKRRLTKDMESLPSFSPMGLIAKVLGKGGDVEDSEEDMGAEEKSDFQKEIDRLLMRAEQPNNNRDKYSFQPNNKGAMNAQFGNTTDKYTQADFFNTVMNRDNDTRSAQERDYQLDQERQMNAAINRTMNPRDNQPSVVSNTGSTTEEDGNDDDDTYPYFGYQRQFQTPMSFQDILNRAYTSDPDRKNMLESFGDMFARIKKDNA